MSYIPQVYRKYDLLFTPRLISKLRGLRNPEWTELVDRLDSLPETHPDTIAFSMMMIKLSGCLTCEMDSYRAQRGCAACAQNTIASFKGSDAQLLKRYEKTRATVAQHYSDQDLQQAA
ncbi:MAG: hypothetical protein KDJ52_31970 [Anaerolineae bacterium]|nr:hypothetical protein [Anaerolineae bacterium]